MSWSEEWANLGHEVKEQAATRKCEQCGTQLEVGFSNLGIPVTACPNCQPSLVANRRKTVGEAWGFEDE